MKLGPGLSFSWKRALGVTKAKRRVSKKTGIPMSRMTRLQNGFVGVLATSRTKLVRLLCYSTML